MYKRQKKAFPAWSATPIKERVQIFYRYRNLMEKHMDELSYITHLENGKTIDEARAEVEKSIELTEFACSLPQLIGGEILEVSKGVECRIDHAPLGVVASIAPFNFPHMVPHWTIPVSYTHLDVYKRQPEVYLQGPVSDKYTLSYSHYKFCALFPGTLGYQ